MDVSQALSIWRGALVASVRADTPDLTARQMAILLVIYRDQAPATVRGLAQTLNLQKPAVTRALDRLCQLGLVRRKIDEHDRRNVLIQRTVTGSVFLNEFAQLIIQAGQGSRARTGGTG
ncbi:MAG: MarR family transcriptional regulator [Alphaproteobacteria bacterium]|nr:MarR family transcriptional regulator [Alphaproteobacteria bacterium]